MEVQLHRLLLPLLFLLSWPFFLNDGGRSPARDASPPDLYPIVLLPGHVCSQLSERLTGAYEPPAAICGARKGEGWFRLWENYTALQQDPALVPCYADQLRLVYDPVARDYRDAGGGVGPLKSLAAAKRQTAAAAQRRAIPERQQELRERVRDSTDA
ncbi:lecithin-cholesterol acyltransferase-like 1 [Panicum miliaceum]|uniref:Lecithin-cholesterol acyltransferase-like 1 n=1 Tax=Panicum miliaceum TaxID=4540 RepID=A0A3L6SFE0_PANMI|nr:lecithin-cholesterol acyltransferase-like 1 [Panicum miliaceum]